MSSESVWGDEIRGLIAAAHGGDRDALGRLLEVCRPYLLTIANEELDPDLRVKGGASDLVQESFLEAQRDFGRFPGQSQDDLLGWLRRILCNNLADFRRRFRDAALRQLTRERPPDHAERAELDEKLIADTPTPGERAITRERVAALQAALGRLSPEYQLVLRLRHQESLSFPEIGERLGRSAEAARKLWFRAVQRLREEMGRCHADE